MNPKTETEPNIDRVAGFSLLGSLGKRVLRPGGAELTERLLEDLGIDRDDDVVEIAPGRGRTARLILDRDPASYVGVDRDQAAERSITPMLTGPNQHFRLASASRTGLADGACTV
ncbi:MAG TPA: SAM-dependent methyltransferase, partial [Acidimicrobiales bacterium]|nr:SAM-dependent methyltransferase [Acidimicrobiales bacterium]